MFKKLLVGAVAVPMLFTALSVSAEIFSFTKITNNNVEDLSSQLSVDVTDAGGGLVSFVFLNNVGTASSVADVYFDNGSGTYLTDLEIGTETGVAFSLDANPGNLPGGNPIGFVADYSADSDAPVAPNGINSATDSLQLLGTGDYAYILAGLTSGEFKIGLHVQAIGVAGGSDGYVTGPSAVPLPAAAWLFASGLGFFGVARRRLFK